MSFTIVVNKDLSRWQKIDRIRTVAIAGLTMAALTKEGGQKLDCKILFLMNQLVMKNVNYQVYQ